MMKRFFHVGLVAGLTCCALMAVELEVAELDVSALAEGEVPREVLFVVDGVFEVRELEGRKCVAVNPLPITDANAQFGNSAKGDAWVEARVYGVKRGRSFPRFGVSVHGMSGYRLMMNAALKQVELVKNDEGVAKAAVSWESEVWLRLRLEAVRAGEDGPWMIRGFVGDAAEPVLVHEDGSGMKGTGKCGLWATPYSEQPVYFDGVRGGVAP